jgi:DNA-directed RNA polymerase subunit alpha
VQPEYDNGAVPGRKPELYDKPIEELDLSVRVFNSLKRTGITTIGDVLDMLQRGPDAMLAIRNFGEKSLDELITKLKEKGYLTETPDLGDFNLSGE